MQLGLGEWMQEKQISFCTREANCAAPANKHEADCPVEKELKDSLGF